MTGVMQRSSSYVSGVMHPEVISVVYPAGMPARFNPDTSGSGIAEPPLARFARVVRTAREEKGWTQPDLAERSGVSRPTIQRYETMKNTPQPIEARKVFKALGLDPRLIPVLLGYVTAEEMGVPTEAQQVLTPTAEEALRILQDPAVPAAVKSEWVQFLKFRVAAELPASGQEPPKAG
jgi:transcriptional regulator with XRE-family HTH domain